jgi:hypothetical protein
LLPGQAKVGLAVPTPKKIDTKTSCANNDYHEIFFGRIEIK